MKRLLKIVLSLVGMGRLLKYCCLGIVAGLSNFLFIRIVTRVIGLITAGELKTVSRENLLLFAFAILLFVWLRRSLTLIIIHLSQTLFWKLRKQTLSLVLNANYQQLSSRRVRIRSTMLGDVSVLTEASMNIIQFFTAFILSVTCFIYLLTISQLLFLITLCVASLGITIYHQGAIRNMRTFRTARELENKFQEHFYAILDGFKEIYMEPRKGREIFDHKISPVATDAFTRNTRAFTGFLNNQIVGQVLFYILISSVLLFFSIVLNIPSGDTVSFVFTLLYLVGSIETIMALLPGLVRARVASDHLMDLKTELEEANFNNPVPNKYITKAEFGQIAVRGLEFYYGDQTASFGIGPLNLDIEKGEIIFIYGGNGSGKTTLFYAILGLCFPSAGRIFLNDVAIDADNYADYRTAFSVVFNDFYLFNEILGVEKINIEKWNYYISLFELEDKVEMESDRRFSTTALSTGQRKRLALIAALMEEKPVLVLDEWAADQDPYFRKKFYTEILPLLKKEDITILAITHDDRYYYCADKLYKMDYGKLSPEPVPANHLHQIVNQ